MPTNSVRQARRGVSLERRIPLLIIALLAGLLSFTLVLAYQEVHSSAIIAGRERLDRLSQQFSELLQNTTSQRIASMAAVASNPSVAEVVRGGSGAASPDLIDLLEGLRSGDRSIPIEIWRNPERQPVLSLPSSVRPPYEQADFPEEGGYGSWFSLGERTYSFVAVPIREEDRIIGHLVQLRPFGSPGTAAGLQELLGSDASVYVIDVQGAWAGLDGARRAAPEQPIRPGPFEFRDARGPHLAHASVVPGTSWTVVIEHPLAAVLGRAESFLRRGLILLLVMTGIGALGAWLLSRRFTIPLRSLTEAAERIAAGDYSQRVDLDRPDELGMLGESFNSMASEIHAAHEDLQEQVEEARALASELEAANDRLKELMSAAENAQRSAEEASRAKTGFLATMSHELRTPINAIVGYTDLLLLGVPGRATPEQFKLLDRLRRSGRHLTRLIDDILDLAKIEAGQLHVSASVGAAEEAMDSALSMISPLAEEKGVAVSTAWSDGAATYYQGDHRRVEQILVNLVGNAVKFTPSGGRVTLSCERVESSVAGDVPGAEVVRFLVEDTGVGVPENKREVIFERFVQGEGGFRRSYEGAGLGLAISRELARMMGGDITVRSALGKGSCFTLTLPAGSGVAAGAAPAAERSISFPVPSVRAENRSRRA